jgi:hypothetical protein
MMGREFGTIASASSVSGLGPVVLGQHVEQGMRIADPGRALVQLLPPIAPALTGVVLFTHRPNSPTTMSWERDDIVVLVLGCIPERDESEKLPVVRVL